MEVVQALGSWAKGKVLRAFSTIPQGFAETLVDFVSPSGAFLSVPPEPG